jgi:hypothetical protein
MPPSNVFVDSETGELDTEPILYEAIPIAKLIALVVTVALVPLAVGFVVSGILGLHWQLALSNVLLPFVLAVGAGVALFYVITRVLQIAEQ